MIRIPFAAVRLARAPLLGRVSVIAIVAVLLRSGLALPDTVFAQDASGDAEVWWSLRPLTRSEVPEIPGVDSPIDAFIEARRRLEGLPASPEADRRTLARRLWVDLLGFPPTPEEVAAFEADDAPLAYERLVDRLLASPAYGERWARHWLDVVHYGESHGYDKDKPRPNAWPYRDYVIRAFNEDRPWGRFVREQVAGDALWPDTRDGVAATGFLAAGPWDFIGHAEVPETKIDGKVARNLDRDDMVGTVMTALQSTTVQCARCHDHKFDPVTMVDYYGLQAVFAALDRADRPYESDPDVAARRRLLTARRDRMAERQVALDSAVRKRAGEGLTRVERELGEVTSRQSPSRPAEYGYHSEIAARADVVKWVAVDLGARASIERIVLRACDDDFAGIGAGFGFPVRFRVETANDEDFQGARIVADHQGADVPNPGLAPFVIEAGGHLARYVRVTATKLAYRQSDWIFALAELEVLGADGLQLARGRPVASLDSIEAPVRWRRTNLVDGFHPGSGDDPELAARAAKLRAERDALLRVSTSPSERKEAERLALDRASVEQELAVLPPPGTVYAGTVHSGSGAFLGTGHSGGAPREIRVLRRGDVQQPGELVTPGALRTVPELAPRFDLPESHSESARRVALAGWLVDHRNALTWRSVANRLWQYHFGRGIVDTPNDFGRMGSLPTHPELLEWLAIELRDGGETLKRVQRLIVTSAAYRQVSSPDPEIGEAASAIDASNRFLWRMNRRRLEAEALRDGVLRASGGLDRRMFGPSFQNFVVEKPEHSPHYQYHLHDPSDPAAHRRAIYRFIVRSQPDPFLETLDCADPSQQVARRGETLTALQALALYNDAFVLAVAKEFATSLEATGGTLEEIVTRAVRRSLCREPEDDELVLLSGYAREHGIAAVCRVLFNSSEFVFVD